MICPFFIVSVENFIRANLVEKCHKLSGVKSLSSNHIELLSFRNILFEKRKYKFSVFSWVSLKSWKIWRKISVWKISFSFFKAGMIQWWECCHLAVAVYLYRDEFKKLTKVDRLVKIMNSNDDDGDDDDNGDDGLSR